MLGALNKDDRITNLIPDGMFAFLTNLRNRKLCGDDIQIVHKGNDWEITRGEIRLLSYTPKMTSFGMNHFADKFERYFEVEKGDKCLDVGACIGDTTIPMGIKSQCGEIIAIEPEPRNFRYLAKIRADFPMC